ncbi:hypothetical protein QFC19_009196 [Naganishia cerealis]|uniref:Uncharacterized protein n=1 Tax=Naganishia cerealis TaxID=610337 RepID=A0ACC2UX09_9TREE|nr:hypothetical protein QFC19_009196 [Naganishia cerealis]
MESADIETSPLDEQPQQLAIDSDDHEVTKIEEEHEKLVIPESPSGVSMQVRPDEVEKRATDNVQALTDEINSLRSRVSALDHQLANADQENVRLETQHTNLSTSFAQLQRELAELEASSKFVAAAKDAVDKELAEEKRKRETAEETVEVLRGKVDDARKAIGTLQKQDKRSSIMLTGTESPGLDALGMSSLDDGAVTRQKTSKRASILFGANATSKANRRLSGASDHEFSSNVLLSPPSMGATATPTLPQAPVNAKGLREFRLSSAGSGMPPSPNTALGTGVLLDSHKEGQSNRWSGLGFGGGAPRGSPTRPPNGELREDSKEDLVEELGVPKQQNRPSLVGQRASSSSFQTSSTDMGVFDAPANHQIGEDQLLALHKEISSLRSKLEESQEARVASESCLKVLREFVASSNSEPTPQALGDQAGMLGETGFAGIKLPPLPTDRDPEGEDEPVTPQKQPQQGKKGGWGLGLWRSSAPANASTLTTSTRSEAGDVRSNASAVQSPSLEADKQFPELHIDDHESHTRSLVSTWSKGVPTGGAKVETPPAALLAPSPVNAKKGFSFFTRSTSDRDVAADDETNDNEGEYEQATKGM